MYTKRANIFLDNFYIIEHYSKKIFEFSDFYDRRDFCYVPVNVIKLIQNTLCFLTIIESSHQSPADYTSE